MRSRRTCCRSAIAGMATTVESKAPISNFFMVASIQVRSGREGHFLKLGGPQWQAQAVKIAALRLLRMAVTRPGNAFDTKIDRPTSSTNGLPANGRRRDKWLAERAGQNPLLTWSEIYSQRPRHISTSSAFNSIRNLRILSMQADINPMERKTLRDLLRREIRGRLHS